MGSGVVVGSCGFVAESCCGVIGGGFGAVGGIDSGVSVGILTLWASGSLLSGAVDVLELVGGGVGGSG